MQRFEELEVWVKARKLTQEMYEITKTKEFERDKDLVSQIRRASVSIMANIAEGKERGSEKEFRQFLFTAKGSAGEVRALLYVAVDQNYIEEYLFDKLIDQTAEVSRMISGLIKKL